MLPLLTESIPTERGVSTRVAFRCDLAEARVAARILRAFLGEQGLDETEQFNCELCLAEACNNAVHYADPEGAAEPVIAEVICHGASIELRVTDHTPGFVLGEKAPEINLDRENGRGLFIIQSMMDEVHYFRGQGENTLVMRKKRTHQQHRPDTDTARATLDELRNQLESCQQTISGMARELCFRSESLAAIFRCCTELGREGDLEGFAHRLLNDLLHLTSADWFVLRLVPANEPRISVFAVSSSQLRAPPLELTAGTEPPGAEVAAATTRREVELDCRHHAVPNEPLRLAGGTAVGLVHPLLVGDRLVGTLAIGRSQAVEGTRTDAPFSVLQAEMIRTFAEFMAMQVVTARHHEEAVHARLVAHELDIAHRIQRALLPRTLPQLAGFGLAANWESARQVGGDFYDAIQLNDHSLLLVVADVMGKGVPAAMFATIMRSLLRAMAWRSHHPARLLKRLNELLYEELSSVGMFITAQLVFVDLHRRQLVAASAGHCPILVASDDSVRTLRVTGTPLGILPDATYRQQTASLAAPARLLLYTDGVTEALNPAGEMFGHERLADWFRAQIEAGCAADALRDQLAVELTRFRAAAPLRDDQAFLLLAENPVRSSSAPPAGKVQPAAVSEPPLVEVSGL